jgi:hypothetical protein
MLKDKIKKKSIIQKDKKKNYNYKPKQDSSPLGSISQTLKSGYEIG